MYGAIGDSRVYRFEEVHEIRFSDFIGVIALRKGTFRLQI